MSKPSCIIDRSRLETGRIMAEGENLTLGELQAAAMLRIATSLERLERPMSLLHSQNLKIKEEVHMLQRQLASQKGVNNRLKAQLTTEDE